MKDIKNVQTQNIFRLSAILYSKTNDIVSNKSIIRRVIEDALYCCDSDIITISELITYIHSNYALLFTENEIKKIVTDKKYSSNFLFSYNKNRELQLSLTQERKNKVTINCQQKTLLDFIEDYLTLYESDSLEQGQRSN